MFPFEDDISGTIRGYRVFTACRTVNGKIFRMEDHFERLYNSATGIYMQPPMSKADLQGILHEVVRRNLELNSDIDLHLEIVFSGGLSGSTMKQSGRGAHLYVAVHKLEPPSPEMYEKGVALATFAHQRLMPDIKLLNYVGAIVANQTVVPEHDAYDVLFVDPSDKTTVLEGSTFTVFFVDSEGRIVTPPLDGKILDSITRKVVIEILQQSSEFTVVERQIGVDEISALAEAFLVSTTRSALPVTRIDRIIIGQGSPGPVTKRVISILQDYLKAY
jgi:branched-chain amino acid aminotransferase